MPLEVCGRWGVAYGEPCRLVRRCDDPWSWWLGGTDASGKNAGEWGRSASAAEAPVDAEVEDECRDRYELVSSRRGAWRDDRSRRPPCEANAGAGSSPPRWNRGFDLRGASYPSHWSDRRRTVARNGRDGSRGGDPTEWASDGAGEAQPSRPGAPALRDRPAERRAPSADARGGPRLGEKSGVPGVLSA